MGKAHGPGGVALPYRNGFAEKCSSLQGVGFAEKCSPIPSTPWTRLADVIDNGSDAPARCSTSATGLPEGASVRRRVGTAEA